MQGTGSTADGKPPGWQAQAMTLMFVDVVESMRLVESDELGNAWRIGQLLDALAHLAASQFEARVLERRGDGLLLSWPGHERRAAVCALQMSALADLLGRPGTDAAHAEPILLRFGLHCGNVLSDGQRVYGSDVNLAALAAPGHVLMSQALRDRVNPGIDGDLVDLGDCWVKHAAAPVRVFRWQPVESRAPAPVLPEAPLPCPCIAVLPFRMLALQDAGERSSVVDLVGENIVHALSSTDQLAVVSWFSTRMVDPQTVDLADMARRLGAGWIVSGSCTSHGGRLVIAIELHDAHSRAVAWTARAPATLADLMAAEPDFARDVAQGLVQRVCEGEARRLARHALPNLASHAILTGAIGLMHRSARDSFMKSREALEYLLERHPACMRCGPGWPSGTCCATPAASAATPAATPPAPSSRPAARSTPCRRTPARWPCWALPTFTCSTTWTAPSGTSTAACSSTRTIRWP